VPLESGSGQKVVGRNIKRLKKEGKKKGQAIAIALDVARKSVHEAFILLMDSTKSMAERRKKTYKHASSEPTLILSDDPKEESSLLVISQKE